MQAIHFQHLLDADVLERTHSVSECVDTIEKLWRGQDDKRDARHKFVQGFIRPRGLNRAAGEVAARAIELTAQGKTATEIDWEIGWPTN
jgi:hypothetical protein